MKHKIRGMEHCNASMTLREIGDEYVLSKGKAAMTDEEYAYAEGYARVKMIWNSVFEEDPDFAHVYLGRLIGEIVVAERWSNFLNELNKIRYGHCDLMKKEPVA